jgi:hypothetical protein
MNVAAWMQLQTQGCESFVAVLLPMDSCQTGLSVGALLPGWLAVLHSAN